MIHTCLLYTSFENPKQVNKILADKDENFNRILSQNVKMSLDFRRLKLNGNILICGGSGAGKTFYEVKPNLMQMPQDVYKRQACSRAGKGKVKAWMEDLRMKSLP